MELHLIIVILYLDVIISSIYYSHISMKNKNNIYLRNTKGPDFRRPYVGYNFTRLYIYLSSFV